MKIMPIDDEHMLEKCRFFLKSIDDDLNYITPDELNKILKSDPESVFVLDNRTETAFAEGHIPGAKNIWLKNVLDNDNLELLPKDKRIVVCCWVGHTASQLLAVLQILGFDAVGLKYGMGSPAIKDECKLGWKERDFQTLKS